MFGRDTEHISRRQALPVLLIEHDEAFAGSISVMLDQARDTVGSVVVAGSLQEGLEKLASTKFGVILLEFFLPDGAGLANIAVLQETAPHIPVIVLGAAEDEAIAVEAVHAGAQDYLVKSHINPSWLLRSVRYTIERHEAEITLLAQEKKYHGLFDHLVEGIFQTTSDGRYILANTALARIYGYTTPDELMSSVTDIGERLYVVPGRREEFKRIMDQHDTITGFESQIFRKDGSIIWISENCRAVRDAGGRLLHYEGTVEDITLRRDAQENLRQSEALYHSLVDTMPQSIFRKDLQGKYTFANKQFCRIIGKTLDELLGKTIFDVFPEKLAAKRQDDDWRVMSTGKVVEHMEENQFPGRENGYIHVLKIPIFDANGQVIGLQGMFWDITEQKLAEQRVRKANEELAASQENLRQSEALYHSLLDTMPQNVFRKDLEGRFTFANKEYCKHYKCGIEGIIGKTDFDFFPKELAQKYQADDLSVINTGQTYDVVEEHQPIGQEKSYVQVVKTPLRDADGRIIGLQGIFWDVTAQKLADERIKRANAELAASREELKDKNDQMERDLQMAREIQVAMLPQQFPVLPRGVSPEDSAFQFSHLYLPSGTVGGDFFSVAPISDLEVAVFICDVAGHGVQSSLITAMIRALVEELRTHAHDPGQFMTRLNAELFGILKHSGSPILTTAFYLVANSTTGQMSYVNAGHPKPFLLRKSEGLVEQLKSSTKQPQPALGLFPKAEYQTSEIKLVPHDFVMLYTDGLYEVESASHEIYTTKMLEAATQRLVKLPANKLFDSLLKEVREFGASQAFDDDVCIVGMEFTGGDTRKR